MALIEPSGTLIEPLSNPRGKVILHAARREYGGRSKTDDQLDLQALHRARERLVSQPHGCHHTPCRSKAHVQRLLSLYGSDNREHDSGDDNNPTD